jgi:hypothetical protein
MGQPIDLTIGTPVAAETLARLDRENVASDLRRRCMALASPALADPDETYVWPAHIRW